MSGSSFVATTLGALEGAISVLITLATGFVVARIGILDHATVKRISKLCSSLFLPCLIVESMGPELTVDNIARLWIIPVWGLVSTIFAHLFGWLGQAVSRSPYWLIVAAGRPNTSALPLLLIQSLSSGGVLKSLSPDTDTDKILGRAKSLILLNVVVQQTFTFQLAPFIFKYDRTETDEEGGPATLSPASSTGHLDPIVQDTERVGLLHNYDGPAYVANGKRTNYRAALGEIEDQPDIHWPERVQFLEKPVKTSVRWMSPPLIGAIIALFIGIIPPLHSAFFDEDSGLYNAVTQSVGNLGELFVALQMFIVGAELALFPRARPGVVPTTFALMTRFLLMPGLGLLFVWATAGRGWYVDDKLVWFILILIPSGPSAMLLASVAELVNVDQGPISAYLTISYLFSPFMAIICSLGLIVVENAAKRL